MDEFYHKQFVTFEQRKDVVEDIRKRTSGVIFIGGTAYQSRCEEALTRRGLTKKEALRKLRYSKDIDIFSKDPEWTVQELGEEYEWRGIPDDVKSEDSYVDKNSRTQFRKKVGVIKLKREMLTSDDDKRTERNAYVNVDVISPHYYSRNFPKLKRSEALERLETHTEFSHLFGFPIRIQGLEILTTMKLVNIRRAKDEEENRIVYDKDAADVLNLAYLYGDEGLALGYIAKRIGKENLLKGLGEVKNCITQHETLKDDTLMKIMREQVVPRPLEVSESILIDDRKTELETLEKIIEKLK